MAGLAKTPGKRVPIIRVKDKNELVKQLNAAKPKDKFFKDCKKAATIFGEAK